MRALVLAFLLALPAFAGCTQPAQPPPPLTPVTPVTPTSPTPPSTNASATGLRTQDILTLARAFDANAAFDLVRAQVCTPATGPGCAAPHYRIPGTEGNNETARAIAGWMSLPGWGVTWDNFTASREGQNLPAHNIVAERRGKANDTLYVVAHYDSRPCADEDPNPVNRTQPVLGANDGGSGVAVMVELARVLGERPLNLTLRFVFVDAEDMGDSGHGCGRGTEWAQGASHYAQAMGPQDLAQARGLVLLDLVGDKDLQLRREQASGEARNKPLQDALWAWGAKLGKPQFLEVLGPYIDDDHLPFIQRGVPSVDVIDLRARANVFPDSHHTTFDDLDHVSPASLEATGEATLAALLAWDGGAWDNGLK